MLVTADLLSERFTALASPPTPRTGTLRAAIAQLERELLRDALQRNAGDHTHAATDLGLSRRGLLEKLQRDGLRSGRRPAGAPLNGSFPTES